MNIFNRLRPFSRPLFISAGLLMLIQVLIIGSRRNGLDFIAELWAAPAAMGSVIAIIFGLLTLYPRTVGHAPKLSLASVLSGLASGIILLATSIYLVSTALEFGAIPQPLPPAIQGGVALFMISFVTALILGAAACLRRNTMRSIGFLLLVPVLLWCVILAAAIVVTMTEALRLDVYTNGLIAFALVAIGFKIRDHDKPKAQQ